MPGREGGRETEGKGEGGGKEMTTVHQISKFCRLIKMPQQRGKHCLLISQMKLFWYHMSPDLEPPCRPCLRVWKVVN